MYLVSFIRISRKINKALSVRWCCDQVRYMYVGNSPNFESYFTEYAGDVSTLLDPTFYAELHQQSLYNSIRWDMLSPF